MAQYGFLGIGIMGQAMAANLLAAGHEVRVWNRTAARCAGVVEQGAIREETPAEVVAESEITFAMVSDAEASRALCFGPRGVLEALEPGKAYIEISTIDPDTICTIGEAVVATGARFLEAPVTGSKKPAEDGALVFLCAGDETLYQDAQPALDIMGKRAFFLGETGNGARMKLVNNVVMGTMMAGLSEGLAMGMQNGLKPDDIIEVLMQGAIANPMFALKGPLMAEGNFLTAFPLKHMQKDMRLALEQGERLFQSMPTAAAANAQFLKARAEGHGDEDMSAIHRVTLGA